MAGGKPRRDPSKGKEPILLRTSLLRKRNLRAGLLAGLLAAVLLPAPVHAQDPPVTRLISPVRGCPICDLWLRYEDVILRAKQEVGPIQHGVFYFYHSSDPSVIEPLIRFANERNLLERSLAGNPEQRSHLGLACHHREDRQMGISLEISTSARGFLVLRRSEAYGPMLQAQSARVVRDKIPIWF
jgi:hypothetical protein